MPDAIIYDIKYFECNAEWKIIEQIQEWLDENVGKIRIVSSSQAVIPDNYNNKNHFIHTIIFEDIEKMKKS